MSTYRVGKGDSPPKSRQQRKQRWRRLILGTAAGLVLLLVTGTIFRVERYIVCPGYVTTEHHAEIHPSAVGRVAEVFAHTGEAVRAGDLLVQLDDSEERATLNEERNRQHKLEDELARLRLEIAEETRKLEEQIAIAELHVQDARARRERTQQLLDNGLVAASAMDDAKLRENLARAELDSLLSTDRMLYEKRIQVLERERQAQTSVVARAEARCRTMRVTAPFDGQVVRYEFAVGEVVSPTTVLYELFGGQNKLLKLQIKERHATRVSPGDRYRARLSSYRGLHDTWFEGRVLGLRGVIQGDKDQRYRQAVCSFDAGKYDVPPGTTADARVYYGRSCLWFFLLGLN